MAMLELLLWSSKFHSLSLQLVSSQWIWLLGAGFCLRFVLRVSTNIYFWFAIYEQNSARSTVPGGPSVACSTARAVEWDAAWSKNPDPSGRAALGVHAAAYEEELVAKNATTMINGSPQKVQGLVDKATTVVWLKTCKHFIRGTITRQKSVPDRLGTWFLGHSLIPWTMHQMLPPPPSLFPFCVKNEVHFLNQLKPFCLWLYRL